MGDSRIGQLGLEGLDGVWGKINERVLEKDGIKGYTLDADVTEIIGEKAGALFIYNGNRGCMPMFSFLYENLVCLYKAVKLAIALMPRGDWKEPVKGCGYEIGEGVHCMSRIVKHAGERVLKLMIDLEKLELFKVIRRKSFELSLCPYG
jgi:hypothetical protein